MRRTRSSRVLGLLGAVALLVCSLPAALSLLEDERPNIIVICADTLRADHLGAYGYGRPTSPNLDRLGRRGVRFARAYATASWTGPSVLSLFTSEPPRVHGLQATTDSFDGSIETLAEALSKRGYRTGAVSANFVHVTPERGFDQGFSYFHVVKAELPEGASPRADFVRYNQVTADRVFDLGLAWIRRGGSRPFFLYLHTMDTHAGYKSRPSFRASFDRGAPRRLSGTALEVNALLRGDIQPGPGDVDRLVDLYDAAIASWDDHLGVFLASLSEAGLLEETAVVVLADHGEEFLDHGRFSHGITLYEEMIRVPLIVVLPRGRSGGRSVGEPVSLMDVAPTLLETAGDGSRRWHGGRSLLAVLEGVRSRRSVGAELGPDPQIPGFDAVPRQHRAAVVAGDWKAIIGLSGLETYHLSEDAGERIDLPSHEAPDQRLAVAQAKRIAEAQASPSQDPPPLDRAFVENLRSLGYLR